MPTGGIEDDRCVFDGDEAPLRGLIENPNASEWALASSGLCAYPALIHSGKISHATVGQYFGELLERRLEREPSAVWNNLTSLSGDLGFTSLLPLVRRAFDEDLCDPWFDSLERIEETLQTGGDPGWATKRVPIDDVVSIMENWACFNIAPARPRPRPQPDGLTQLLDDGSSGPREFSSRPVVPPPPLYRGVGRNDPCPCGSGRKFKKCCGAG